MPSKHRSIAIERARRLRSTQTRAESLLWQRLRRRKLAGIKFRRQHPIETFIVDFACIEKSLVIEIDGEYHDRTYEQDQHRQQQLEAAGWRVVRFSNADVLENVESVAIAIARLLGIERNLGES